MTPTQESQEATRRSGIFVPLPEEKHREIKVEAVSNDRLLQEFGTELLLLGLEQYRKGVATPRVERSAPRGRAKNRR